MDERRMRQQLEDFTRFCSAIEVRPSSACADRWKHTPEDAKERYALAIIRAAQNGAFGNDNETTQAAITALWERGHLSGFNTQSFNAVFEEYFRCW